MMAKPWNEHQGTITKLYIKEGRTLKDVRNIMKLKYNFDASTLIFGELASILARNEKSAVADPSIRACLSPPSQSIADVIIKQEEASSPASSSGSSSVSRRSSEQKPLPVLKQPILYPNFFQDQMRSQDDAQTKIDASRAPLWEGLDIDMLRSSQTAQAMLPSIMPIQSYNEATSWPAPRGAPSYLNSPPQPFDRSQFETMVPRYVPDQPLYSRDAGLRSGLRAPDLSVGRPNPGDLLHHMVGYHGVAQG
ncbi:Clr5 domain [Fusarium oxysporum f. sp. vasinfectum]|nr:Clr5 domain [Fusarium oxysporum f. sp. vasinfectum]KAK2929858.1 Clr5 domain [Fusarium oxysporum f. sp. vasinfectum]